jgi:hypothetical protein
MNALRRLMLTGVVLGCVSLGGLAPSANAAVTHKPLFQLAEVPAEWPLGEPVAIPGPPVSHMESMTVDSGHVWVAEGSFRGKSRVDEFDAKTGAFIAQPAHLEAPTEGEFDLPTCYGYACGDGIAVGHGPGEAAVYVAGEKHGASVVSVLNEAGALKATWNGAATPGGSFGTFTGFGYHVGTISDVAVDNSTSLSNAGKGDVFVVVGDLWVSPGTEAIDVFHPETNGEERYVGQITGPSPSEHFKGQLSQIAVDEASGDLFVVEGEKGTVDVFEPTGLGSYAFVRKLGGPPPTGAFNNSIYAITVDSTTGEVYVTESLPGGALRMDQFSATGSYLGQVENIPAQTAAIAVDPESHYLYAWNMVYGPDVVIPDVTTDPVLNLKPESALLNGTVNPDSEGNATCRFEWGTSSAFGHTAPCSGEVANGGSPVPVQVPLSGLERGVTYYYRLQATNTNGTNLGEAWQTKSFTTFGAILRSESVSDVSAESATFEATVNPGKQATSYYFQYGPNSEYGQQVPASPEAIGSGALDVEVPGKHLQGLSPSTEYHYRVVVISEAKPGELETVYGEDHTFTTQAAGGSLSLLGGRQWEMVSPPTKLGALIEHFEDGPLQASAAGDAIAYLTNSPSEAEPQGYAHEENVLSTRGSGGWSSLDISVPHDQAGGSVGLSNSDFQVFSSDLSRAAIRPVGSGFTPLSGEASESTPYLRSDFPAGNAEARCTASCYRPLVTAANTPPGTVFGEEPNGYCAQQACGPKFWGGSPDLSHVILSSPAQLTETPAPMGGEGLYEWSAGRLQLVDVLPPGEEGPAILAGSASTDQATGVRHAVSDTGERVILEGGSISLGGGRGAATGGKGLYLRDVGTGETVRLDVVQGGKGPSEGVLYATASSDASRIFFLDAGRLTAKSSASGEDLYEYNVNAPVGSRLTDLSVDRNAGEAAGVKTVIGASEDGSYVYFIASGALAPGAEAGQLNLYARYEGETKLVAALLREDSSFLNLYRYLFGRVSPNGEWLAFMSDADLTGYDTRDAVSGQPDAEVYLYGSASGRLVCASCDPTGARPVGVFLGSTIGGTSYPVVETGFSNQWVAANVPPWLTINSGGIGSGIFIGTFYQPRYLSNSGRLFFDSADALVAQDVNGTQDVYEYEPVGAGDCSASSATFAPRSNGCLGLVSSGTSSTESGFLDASETGGDVFFMTQAKLAPQDYDTAYDIYDAQECTSAVPCPPAPVPSPPPCETEASCREAPSPQPALYGAPASATFVGSGNVASSTLALKPKAKTKPKPKCKKRKEKQGCPRAKKTKRASRVKTKAIRSRRGGRR